LIEALVIYTFDKNLSDVCFEFSVESA